MMVTGMNNSSPLVILFGRLSVTIAWVIPTLYPAKPRGFVSLGELQVLTRATSLFALFLGQTPMLPSRGFLPFPIVDYILCLIQIYKNRCFGTVRLCPQAVLVEVLCLDRKS